MVDREKIISTFKRIEKSLNLRFEKKGSLFIDKKDLEDLKRSISNGEMQNIQAMETKIDSAIITQVILKNPWLVSDALLRTRDFSSFLKINIARDNHIYFLKNIIDDNIYSTNEFKGFIEKIYYPLIKLSECKKIVKNMTLKDSVVLICFKKIIMDSTEGGSSKIREINDFFNDNQRLYNTVKSQLYLNDIMITLDDKDDVAEWLLDNKIAGKMDKIWAEAFYSLKENAFYTACNYINREVGYASVMTKDLIRRKFPIMIMKIKDDSSLLETYTNVIVNLYEKGDDYRRLLLLQMLKPSKFKDQQELVFNLLDEFENISIPERYDDEVDRIRLWQKESRGFDTIEDIYKKINNPNMDLNKIQTLNFMADQYTHTNNALLSDLFQEDSDIVNIRLSLSYYVAREMNKGCSKLLTKLNPLPLEYVDTICYFISEYSINSDTTRVFLHENNRLDILEKFMER
jgi:hypothetical protein